MNERNYGIDLLRFVLMYMVCMLHVLGQGGILWAAGWHPDASKAYWLMEIAAYCAVDAFAMISGYTAGKKKRKYSRLLDMWFQVLFYSFGVSVILTVAGLNRYYTPESLINNLFPVSTDRYWYFTGYVALFVISPVLDTFMSTVDQKSARRLLVLLFVLFCGIGLYADAFQTKWGYSPMWIIVLYCMGGLAKRGAVFEQKKTVTLILMWAACVGGTWVRHLFVENTKLVIYLSPTVVLSGLILVVLFSRIKLKGTILAKITPLAFGIYLCQLNQVVWESILSYAFTFVLLQPLWIGIPLTLALALGLFVTCLAVECVRMWITKLIRLPKLSEKIISLVEKAGDKVLLLLK